MRAQAEFLSRWLSEQQSFDDCLHPRLIESSRAAKASILENVVCLTESGSFIAWSPGYREEDTGEAVTALWGWEGEQKLPLLLRSIEQIQSHLMIEVEAQSRDSEILQRAGFTLERHRLALTPADHDPNTCRQGRYTLRLASELDRVMLCTLAADYARYTVPPGREELLGQYTVSILSRFRELDFGPESPIDLFIAEDEGRAVGYILVELMPDGTVYVEDVGVKQSHWGKYVAQFLVRAIQNLLVEHEVDLMWCEISAANRRSYLTAVRSLRFEPRVEIWIRRAKNLSPL